LLTHSRELFAINQEHTASLEQLRHEHQMLLSENTQNFDSIQQQESLQQKRDLEKNDMESQLKELKEKLVATETHNNDLNIQLSEYHNDLNKKS
jgi:hypothetical protein